MSGLKSFALAGAGNVGKFIADELIAAKRMGAIESVAILTRPESATNEANAAFAEAGASIVAVDYASPPSLVAALKGIDVVISTLGGRSFRVLQGALARAAQEAGTKLFVPSEFGVDTRNRSGGAWGEKAAIQRELRELGIPHTLFFTGVFSDFIFGPPLGFDFSGGSVTIWGDGVAKNSFTCRADIARYVVRALTEWPVDKLQNCVVQIEGDRTSLNDLVSAYEHKSGTTIKVAYRPITEREVALAADPDDFRAALTVAWHRGEGAIGSPDGANDNAQVKGWTPSKAVDVLLRLR